MAEQYYTVEGITEARVHGKGKSRHWQYLTAWKGYPADESTWEDVTSFQPTDDDQASSEHFITAFWCHVLGDAIVPDPQEYKTRTHFVRKGHPRQPRKSYFRYMLTLQQSKFHPS